MNQTVLELLVHTSHKKDVKFASICLEWERHKLVDKVLAEPLAALSLIDSLVGVLGWKLAAPAVVFALVGAAQQPHAQLSAAHKLYFAKSFEGVVANANFAEHFVENELLLFYFRTVVNGYAHLCGNNEQYRSCLATLGQVIDIFGHLAPHHLSAAHALYLQVALENSHPSAAVAKFRSLSILEVDPKRTAVSLKDYISYYYYGGIALAVHKQWDDAILAFTDAMMIPQYGGSNIMILALKAHLLCCLIHFGSHREIRNPALMRHYGALCHDYLELADAFVNRDYQKVSTLITQRNETFVKDQLLGLVEQVRGSMLRRSILSLTQVYVTSSLMEMSQELGCSIADAREVLLTMIEDGQVIATISDDEKQTVSFFDQPPTAAESNRSLEDAVSTCVELHQRLTAVDVGVQCSEAYAMHTLRMMPNINEVMAEYEKGVKAQRGTSAFQTLVGLARGE